MKIRYAFLNNVKLFYIILLFYSKQKFGTRLQYAKTLWWDSVQV